MKDFTLPLLLMVFCAQAHPALAQTDPKEIYNEGRQLFEDGDFAAAAIQFRAAYEARPTWKILYNIGQSEAAAKHYGAALEAFEEYLAGAGDEITNRRHKEISRELERLRPMVGAVEVTAMDKAEIFIDDLPRGTTPMVAPIKVSAGVIHTLKVVHDGDLLLEKSFKVSAGEQVLIDGPETKDLPPEPVPDVEPTDEPDAPPADTQQKRNPLIVSGWITTGVGAAMLIGGTVTGSMALSINSDLKKQCDGLECEPDQHDDVSTLDTLTTTSTILLAAGGAVAATGVILLIVGSVRKEQPGGGEKAAAWTVTPTVGTRSGGVALTGRF